MYLRGIAVVGVTIACTLTLGGCGKKVVSQSTVQTQVAKELAAETNQPVPKVTCPGDLTAKIGATMKCTLTPQGSTTSLPVTVTVTSIDNGVAHFHAQVGSAPTSQ